MSHDDRARTSTLRTLVTVVVAAFCGADVAATLPAFPVVTDANFNPTTANAATMANLVRQRPFRAFMHASLLVRPTA